MKSEAPVKTEGLWLTARYRRLTDLLVFAATGRLTAMLFVSISPGSKGCFLAYHRGRRDVSMRGLGDSYHDMVSERPTEPLDR